MSGNEDGRGDGGRYWAAADSYLSRREIDVLELIAAGLTNREVASALHMSHHTVAHHLGQMLRRTGARTRGELIARAYAGQIFTIGVWPPSPTGKHCILCEPAVPRPQAEDAGPG